MLFFSSKRCCHCTAGVQRCACCLCWRSPPFSCSLARFAASLTCICRTFMTKDAALSHAVIKHLLRYWPISSSEKLLVFLCTIKDAIAFLSSTGDMELTLAKELMERLRSCMGRCVSVDFLLPRFC